MEYVLEASGLCKRYRDFTALHGLDMHIPKGSIYGFVGRNGAGKTTLIRLICGLQDPTGGSFTLYGVRNTDAKLPRCRRRMGAVVETPSIYLGMTAADNIRQQYMVLGMPSNRGIPELLDLVGLGNTGSKKAGNFSLGMRQRLGIARALYKQADILFFDEATSALDNRTEERINRAIEELSKANRELTIIVVAHRESSLDYCDRIITLGEKTA